MSAHWAPEPGSDIRSAICQAVGAAASSHDDDVVLAIADGLYDYLASGAGFPHRTILGFDGAAGTDHAAAASWHEAFAAGPGAIWLLPETLTLFDDSDVVDAEIVEDDGPEIVDVPADAARQAGL